MNQKSNDKQIEEVSKFINKIQMSKSPYKIVVSAIKKIL